MNQSEFDRLKTELADEAARSDIECHAVAEKHSGKHSGRWYRLTVDSDDREWVARAVLYLDARKKLQRHPDDPALVKP